MHACSVASNSLQLHGLLLACARLLCPWDSPDKNTGGGFRFLLHGSSQARDWTRGSCVSRIGRQILYHCALDSTTVPVATRTSLDHTCTSGEKEYDLSAPYPCKTPSLCVSGGIFKGKLGSCYKRKKEQILDSKDNKHPLQTSFYKLKKKKKTQKGTSLS